MSLFEDDNLDWLNVSTPCVLSQLIVIKAKNKIFKIAAVQICRWTVLVGNFVIDSDKINFIFF